MVTTCFSVQNLLSDFVEGSLTAHRHEELKAHLNDCKACSSLKADLETTLDIATHLTQPELSHEFQLRVAEASAPRFAKRFGAQRLSKMLLIFVVPVLIFSSLVVSFPGIFPWFSEWKMSSGNEDFTRYYPLVTGASEILEEQGSWLHSREALTGSLWEEGGLSPDEFEKAFQIQKGVEQE